MSFYKLMFSMNTGRIIPFSRFIFYGVDNFEWLGMNVGYTPYYTIGGVYFGCKCRLEYRTSDGKYFDKYEELAQ